MKYPFIYAVFDVIMVIYLSVMAALLSTLLFLLIKGVFFHG